MVALAQTLFSQGGHHGVFKTYSGCGLLTFVWNVSGLLVILMTAETILIATGCTFKCLLFLFFIVARMMHVT